MNAADRSLVRPTTAMVLAAGYGRRMRPLTTTTPKPLVRLGGKAMLDHALDRLAAAGVEKAVVNVHYLADLIEAHCARRSGPPALVISDERERLLDTGGGVKAALAHLGPGPFLLHNTDSVWIEGPRSNVARLVAHFDPARMDIALLLAATATSVGFDGPGDFEMDATGRLARRRERGVAPFAYAGVAILSPALFADTPEGPFSLNLLFDRAEREGRLHGLRLDGTWLHVGDPQAHREAEMRLAVST
ncbi:nucleotidyltransferase family protein [Salinarimonas ramus]|uniref:Mannose-1-phosphate guanylyltransferase n=1 Tax=Salinarimonas ramus TaxID=690164 RepID=A0A917Q7F3_9HYPH|nr:nucleotidyltransferase family protein [Salinarimonas ramus]GGK33033.1 mannose-1-phosphate guanylyltransferase [Salinarimonas ramus]